jgi:anti-sigma factor RsiW
MNKHCCCKDIFDLATDYLEDSMDAQARQAFESHIQQCPSCVAFFKTLQATGKICKRALSQRLPAEVQKSLWQFLEKRCNEE